MKFNVRIILLALIVLRLFALSIPVLAEKEYEVILTLESPEPETGAFFGDPIVFNENKLLVGERGATVDGKLYAGKVHLFDLNGSLKLSLHAPKPHEEGEFGCSIAIKGETIAVGERQAMVDGIEEAGQVHLFDINGNLLKTIKSPEPMNGSFFGDSIGFTGDVLVVCEPQAMVDGIEEAGQVHLFDIDGNHVTTLQSTTPHANVKFGEMLATSENIFVVNDREVAHIFNANGGHLAIIQVPETPEDCWLDWMAIHEDIFLISEVDDTFTVGGDVFFFDVYGNLLMTLNSPKPETMANFGSSLAVSEDLIVVGEPEFEFEGEGRVYVFDWAGNLLATLQGSEPAEDAMFGGEVSIIGDMIVVSESSTVRGERNAGQVYFFRVRAKLSIVSDYGTVSGEGSYTQGSTASIRVSPTTVSGDTGVRYIFIGWESSSPGGYTGLKNPVEVVMDKDIVEIAQWNTQFYLTIEEGIGGSVSSSSEWFDTGSEVTINAISDSGFTFSSWIGIGSGSYSGPKSSYNVTLNGPITEKTVFLDIADPIANAGQDRTSKVGETLIFDAMASRDNVGIVIFEWDFGDGTTGTFSTTTHVYKEPGTYTITLTVKDRVGNSAKDTALITVKDITEPVVKDWRFLKLVLYIIGFTIVISLIFLYIGLR